jgi:hypothetical protein
VEVVLIVVLVWLVPALSHQTHAGAGPLPDLMACRSGPQACRGTFVTTVRAL